MEAIQIQLRNWEGAISEADSYEEAKSMAETLLKDVITSLFNDNLIIPKAMKCESVDYLVELPLYSALKIVLRNIMLEERYKKADLAKGLGIPPQRITTFLNLNKSTNLEFIDRSFKFMKRRISITI